MTAPALQQFFPQATRHSLLGPPPVGVSLKPTRLGFPNLPFQRQNRMFRKVSSELRAVLEFSAALALRAVGWIVGEEPRERREPYNEKSVCTVLLAKKWRNKSIPKVLVVCIYI